MRTRQQRTPRHGTLVQLLALTLCVAFGIVLAQEAEERAPRDPVNEERSTDARYKGREHIRIDHEAVKKMSREERRAYMQAYKKARGEEASRAGVVVPPKGDGVIRVESSAGEDATARRLTPKGPGTAIRYDSGTVFGISAATSNMVGNRFDTALEGGGAGTMCCFPVETTGTVTMITFDMVNTFFSSAIFSIYSNIMGTTAQQVTSRGRSVMIGLNTLTLMSESTANSYMNGSFLAGIWQFTPMSTAVGLDSNSTGGQGFHAVRLNDGATGSALAPITSGGMGLNAIVRVRGNVATPVELMSFEVIEE